jgi:hypothetical protein
VSCARRGAGCVAMTRIETTEDFERARERLRRRDCDALAAFVLSLAMDSGAVGEQVRTFIVGDNVAETVESVRQRIGSLKIPSEYEHRHSLGQQMGAHLDFIVDSVERLVLPRDPNAALDLLVAMFEADQLAMENCGEHDWEVDCAYQRATGVMAEAAKHLSRAEVEKRVKALIEVDAYGVRVRLARVFLPDKHDEDLGSEA